ncbi:hypothetical protein GUJ93_ZPchr0002g23379 [Zizania palustris]|uniref:Uncharacterized protein n=1 Tax=Zizania palustris TaxID=103762 RepID=A0A8J5VHA2_ZIZPA|nr:hypothetical protein GUJ93_ZPchr0002g23379 [Zizania palustris]
MCLSSSLIYIIDPPSSLPLQPNPLTLFVPKRQNPHSPVSPIRDPGAAPKPPSKPASAATIDGGVVLAVRPARRGRAVCLGVRLRASELLCCWSCGGVPVRRLAIAGSVLKRVSSFQPRTGNGQIQWQ